MLNENDKAMAHEICTDLCKLVMQTLEQGQVSHPERSLTTAVTSDDHEAHMVAHMLDVARPLSMLSEKPSVHAAHAATRLGMLLVKNRMRRQENVEG